MAQGHEEKIRDRAHRIWEQEGRPEGRSEEHWARAAEELRREQEDTLDRNVKEAVPAPEQYAEPEVENPIRRRVRKAATRSP